MTTVIQLYFFRLLVLYIANILEFSSKANICKILGKLPNIYKLAIFIDFFYSFSKIYEIIIFSKLCFLSNLPLKQLWNNFLTPLSFLQLFEPENLVSFNFLQKCHFQPQNNHLLPKIAKKHSFWYKNYIFDLEIDIFDLGGRNK